MLSQAEIDSFVAEGFVAVRGAVPADVDKDSAPTRARPVHAASWPHAGRNPRLIAQPGVALRHAFPLVRPLSPVELAMATDGWPVR